MGSVSGLQGSLMRLLLSLSFQLEPLLAFFQPELKLQLSVFTVVHELFHLQNVVQVTFLSSNNIFFIFTS